MLPEYNDRPSTIAIVRIVAISLVCMTVILVTGWIIYEHMLLPRINTLPATTQQQTPTSPAVATPAPIPVTTNTTAQVPVVTDTICEKPPTETKTASITQDQDGGCLTVEKAFSLATRTVQIPPLLHEENDPIYEETVHPGEKVNFVFTPGYFVIPDRNKPPLVTHYIIDKFSPQTTTKLIHVMGIFAELPTTAEPTKMRFVYGLNKK